MALVHSYSRFSSMKQAAGSSDWRQKDRAVEWIKRNGHELAGEIFFDQGKSGFKGNKQKRLADFLQAIESGQVQKGDILLIEAFDRLSRKGIDDTREIVSRIWRAGVDIVILSPSEMVFKASESKNNLTAAIMIDALAHQAHAYSANLSDRLKRSWKKSRLDQIEKGKKFPANRPAWIDKKEDGSFVLNEHAETIRYIFKRAIEGVGTIKLCEELNQQGIPSFGAKRKGSSSRWNKVTIRDLIREEKTIGKFQPHVQDEEGKRVPIGEKIDDYYPPVVDEKTYNAANAAMNRRTKERGKEAEDWVYLLNGLVFSANDDSAIRVYSTKPNGGEMKRRLQTAKNADRLPGACRHTIDLFPLENAVLKVLKDVDPKELTRDKKKNLEIQSVQGELDRTESQLKKLQAKLTDDPDLDFLIPAIQQLRNTQVALNDRLRKLMSEAATDYREVLRSIQEPVIEAEKAKERAVQDHDALPPPKRRYPNWGTDRQRQRERLISEPLRIDGKEMRRRLRDSLKQLIEKIVVATYKYGETRNAPIVTYANVRMKTGLHRSFVLYKGKIAIARAVEMVDTENLSVWVNTPYEAYLEHFGECDPSTTFDGFMRKVADTVESIGDTEVQAIDYFGDELEGVASIMEDIRREEATSAYGET